MQLQSFEGDVKQSEKYGQKLTIFRALSEAGKWKLETANWKLEIGNWKLETGIRGCRLPI
jgi:hypothetical protein